MSGLLLKLVHVPRENKIDALTRVRKNCLRVLEGKREGMAIASCC